MFRKVWAKRESICESSSSAHRAHSQVAITPGRKRSSSVATVELRPAQARLWSVSPMAARKTVDLEEEGRGDGAACESPRHLLTVDSPESTGRRPRRTMSAKRSEESRPRLATSPKDGSGRGRRTSDMTGEIGQLRLTPIQITLVRKLWQSVRAQGKTGAGLQVLRDHLFFRHPEIRDLFFTGASAASSETNYHKRLMAHAEALGNLLEEVIGNLEDGDALREKLKELGRLHIKWRDIGFKAAYWDYLTESLNDCSHTWCQKSQGRFDTQVAMTTMVMFMVDNMKGGYMEECRRLRRSVYDGTSRERHLTGEHEQGHSPRRVI